MQIILSLLKLLSLYWLRDYWMSHALEDQRAAYQKRIKEIKAHEQK